MKAGTSPSLDSNGYAAFQANTGDLWFYDGSPGGGSNWGYGMKAGTSPSIDPYGIGT